MSQANNINSLDKRLIERNIRRGLLPRKEYEKFMKTLPDVAKKGEAINVSADEDDDHESDEE